MNILTILLALSTVVGVLGMLLLVVGALATASIDSDSTGSAA